MPASLRAMFEAIFYAGRVGKQGFMDAGIGAGVSGGTIFVLILALVVALGFEFVNGFHDTANAVATVIYTKSLKPVPAVIWSGFVNFLGVLVGGLSGAAVAFSIVHLLPVDLLIQASEKSGIFMVMSLLIAAITWNLATWYFGIPSSSSHALIGSILGVGLAASVFNGAGFGSGVNWAKAQEVGKSLLVSPLIGFCAAAVLLFLAKKLIRIPTLYQEPKGEEPPPFWIRVILFATCTAVSFFHGSNDGQKGVGLIMLILIGLLPVQFALNPGYNANEVAKTAVAAQQMQTIISNQNDETAQKLRTDLAKVQTDIQGAGDLNALPSATRAQIRADVLRANDLAGKWEKAHKSDLSAADAKAFSSAKKQIGEVTDFVVWWVPAAVAVALGGGTMIGWKRIVVTVGEKIGKTHLTYAQGACAELVAAATISGFDKIGLPVSTTHILSSGVAGTMAANKSGLQFATVRNIILAWVLTLPVTIVLAGGLFALAQAFIGRQ